MSESNDFNPYSNMDSALIPLYKEVEEERKKRREEERAWDSLEEGPPSDFLDDWDDYVYKRQHSPQYSYESVLVTIEGWYEEWLPYLEYIGAESITKLGYGKLNVRLPAVKSDYDRGIQLERINRLKEKIPEKRRKRLMREAKANLKKFATR